MSKTIMTQTINGCIVNPAKTLDLSKRNPRKTFDLGDREEAAEELATIQHRLINLHTRLHAEGKRSLLVVLQAMDAGGKDGTIRKVFGPLNGHWLGVTDFKAPTDAELARDYLWRIHAAMPKRGTIGIFNRSHYEDVLIARVRGLAPAGAIRRRYEQINAFEKHLTENGVTILKIHLQISKKEQRQRFEDRISEPDKRWKFSTQDVEERKHWSKYMDAYEMALQKCSTRHAPWYIVPADRKWARNVIIARIVLDALEAMAPQIPEVNLTSKHRSFK